MGRRKVRAEFERRFTAGRMAADYIEVYGLLSPRETAKVKINSKPKDLSLPPQALDRGAGTCGWAKRTAGLFSALTPYVWDDKRTRPSRPLDEGGCPLMPKG